MPQESPTIKSLMETQLPEELPNSAISAGRFLAPVLLTLYTKSGSESSLKLLHCLYPERSAELNKLLQIDSYRKAQSVIQTIDINKIYLYKQQSINDLYNAIGKVDNRQEIIQKFMALTDTVLPEEF